MTLEEITRRHEHPILGIIGAALPSPDYSETDAYMLGYKLRELVEKKGSLFTGGMPGVGLDFYNGVVDYCTEREADDKFFVVFPNGIEPPKEYSELAKRAKNGVLRIERAGVDLEERRAYLAAVADVLIVINGSSGTVDEVLKGLMMGKHVFCLQNSGGAAEVISKFKRGEMNIPLQVNKNLIRPFNSVTNMVNYLSNSFYKEKTKNGNRKS